MTEYAIEPNEEEELLIAAKYGKNHIAEETRGINWHKAKTGWTNYFDDGIVTLSAKVFFRKRKNHD